MPSNVVHTRRDEEKWTKAVEIAKDDGRKESDKDFYAYVMGIYKKMKPSHEFKTAKDQIPGGLSDKKKPSDFDPKAVAKGQKVEMEHTDDPSLAREIARDHLTEDPAYYDKLERMEAGKCDKKAAIPKDLKDQLHALLREYGGKAVPDSKVHGLADKAGVSTDEVESYVYSLASKWVSKQAAAGGKYRVYLFSDSGEELWSKEFTARDDKDADNKAATMVRPQLDRFDDVDDWVVEPVGKRAMLDGFTLFDDVGPEPEETPEMKALAEFERKFGMSQIRELAPSMMKDNKVIELAQHKFRYVQPHKAWFIYADISSGQATRFGLRAFKGLVGRRNLHSSIPALHQVPLWVGTNDGRITQVVPPAAGKKADAAGKASAQLALMRLLSQLRALRDFILNCHWTASGTGYYGDHLLFQRLYEAMDDQIDGLAEKLVDMYGVDAVDPKQQAMWTAFWIKQWDEIPGDNFDQALAAEQDFKGNIKQVLDLGERLDVLTVGMINFLEDLSDKHDTDTYLLSRRLTTDSNSRSGSSR